MSPSSSPEGAPTWATLAGVPDALTAPLDHSLSPAAAAAALPDGGVKLARALLQQRRFGDAEALLDAILRAHPDHFEARYGAGVLKLNQGDAEGARHHLERAQQLDPERPEPYQALARTFLVTGEVEEGAFAIEALLTAHPDDPPPPPALVMEAVRLHAARGDHALLAKRLTQLEAISDLTPGHIAELGRYWAELGDPAPLLRLADSTTGVAAHYLRGLAAEAASEKRAAMTQHIAALEAQPDFWPAHERMARLHLDIGSLEEAARHIAAAEASAPRTPEVRLARALYDLRTNPPEAAEPLQFLASYAGVQQSIREAAQAALDAPAPAPA